jgi:hypothetical protein
VDAYAKQGRDDVPGHEGRGRGEREHTQHTWKQPARAVS